MDKIYIVMYIVFNTMDGGANFQILVGVYN